MLTVKKENVIYKIDESEKGKYLKNGYVVIDSKGKIVEGLNKKESKEFESEISTLKEKQASLEAEIKKLTEENDSLKDEKTKLEAKVQEVTDANNALVNEKKDLEKQVKNSTKENKDKENKDKE